MLAPGLRAQAISLGLSSWGTNINNRQDAIDPYPKSLPVDYRSSCRSQVRFWDSSKMHDLIQQETSADADVKESQELAISRVACRLGEPFYRQQRPLVGDGRLRLVLLLECTYLRRAKWLDQFAERLKNGPKKRNRNERKKRPSHCGIHIGARQPRPSGQGRLCLISALMNIGPGHRDWDEPRTWMVVFT
jgi:hypothetical protein